MDKCRLLPLTVLDSSANMALDEALLKSVGEGDSSSALRFYRWDPSAVSIGRFQGLDYEVDLDVASEEGVDVVRRITGGGSVFHDSFGELTYSFVSDRGSMPDDVLSSFREICGALVEGFGNIGLDASFREVNDVLVDGKKISGSAQTRKYGAVLQHGTILIDPDVELMFRLLKVPEEKITDKFVSSVYKRVTTINRELGKKPSFEKIRESMAKGFEKQLGLDLFEDTFSNYEKELAHGLESRYSSNEWTEKR